MENANTQATVYTGIKGYARLIDSIQTGNRNSAGESTAVRHNEPLVTDGPATYLLYV